MFNFFYMQTQTDSTSLRSTSSLNSSEDLSIREKSFCCCSTDSRNPTHKRDRQLQLFKVNINVNLQF